ncbi:MAG: restriction endonuclease subunit R [Sphingobacteriia bacterium 35-40-8]|nr:MAG: restriction endonuclease subunit R [Sphingobacteriia bacterium 35-40-8]OZA66987.1 MAG: restriction endonuclease subunit R [Sphingobacteriia bacterium 39-39-8]HQS04281.1 DEAD/DEAH box helicase family protein [Daejeonella sp.]
MTENTQQQELTLFRSLFKGREDVFAIRWEKESKSGYIPAYFYDHYRLKAHIMRGGTFGNFTEKKLLQFTDTELLKHLAGEHLAGVYPLLPDNTSWFITADFDKENWLEECKQFQSVCEAKQIPAYLERSRSGKGGHVWIFFDQPYPAFRSRKIIVSILEQMGLFSIFDKSSSFDRLFPNQDFLSGKGFGNLIALPLFKKSLELGNSCFIDKETSEPYKDQWRFLRAVKRISTKALDKLFEATSGLGANIKSRTTSGKLTIRLNNSVSLSREGLTTPLNNFLKEELNFANTEFFIKKMTGRNTFGTERYFKLIEETESEVIIPKGFVGKLIRFCKGQNVEFEFQDERLKHKEISFLFNTALREHQQSAIEATAKKDLGIIVAPPGSGKTIVALKIIAEKKQPTLIITHRKQIAEQWAERIQTFLGIPKHEIGNIGQVKTKAGKNVTIAMIQSLTKELEKPNNEHINAFGLVIIDECHHIPAKTFRNTISKLNTFYSYGLTATPFRKYNDGKLMFIHLGEVISEIKLNEIKNSGKARIVIRNTELDIPFNPKTDQFETLSKILVHDSTRNKLILSYVITELKADRKTVIITERKEHIDSLYQYLKQSYEVVTLSGDDSEKDRTTKWKFLKNGNYEVLITTGQFFGEGTDLQNVNCLFLVYPFSFEGKLIQYIGRVQRSEITPTIYDFRDIKIEYLNKMFLKRNTYYRKIDKQASLFDDPIEEDILPTKTFAIQRKVKIPIEKLEFRYGSIAFKYLIPEINKEIEFDFENLEIRPEFEVLKSYFSKILKLKSVEVEIQAEFENGNLLSQLASSKDIQKINKEIIESVKFKFITKNFLAKPNADIPTGLQDIDQLQSGNDNGEHLYSSGEELLNDLIKNREYKHRKHLQYLADRHTRAILKIRFVLSPFSFVFLLKGKEHFHFIMETLDTEEATYVWHFDNDKRNLPDNLRLVDEHLNLIRNKGRQVFLEKVPDNFSRIVHDYSDERKGLVTWKDLLEERLT